MDQVDENTLIITMHDTKMKHILKETKMMPSRLGEVSETEMKEYKVILRAIVSTLTNLGYMNEIK